MLSLGFLPTPSCCWGESTWAEVQYVVSMSMQVPPRLRRHEVEKGAGSLLAAQVPVTVVYLDRSEFSMPEASDMAANVHQVTDS